MQEPVKENARQKKVQRKSLFNIIVAAIVVVVILAAAGVAYGIFNNSYNANLAKLKTMVAESQAQYANGHTGAAVTFADQAQWYLGLTASVANEEQILVKLNGRYPLLLGRATEKSLGLAELQAKLEAMTPALNELKACIGDDGAINSSLASILAKGASAGQSAEYSGLAAANDSLKTKLGGMAFEGKLEEGRAALAAAVEKRSAALIYLVDDAAISEELAKLSADMQTAPADQKSAFEALLEKNNALEAKAAGVDLSGYGSSQADIPGMLSARKELINAYIGYMGELVTMQAEVAAFCSGLEGATAQDGKLSVKLDSYMVWVKQLKDLRTKLDGINIKEQYKGITAKWAVENLGMTAAGQTLLSYESALNAVNSAVASSKDIEKKIDALIAEKKLDLPDKISQIQLLVGKNNIILASIGVTVPDDMKTGLESFAAACTERVTFLNEFMGYVEDQKIAALCGTTASDYTKKRNEYLGYVTYWKAIEGEDGANVKYYQDLADEQKTLADDQQKLKNTANKNASKHKTAYEASRKKYKPLLDK